MKQQNNMNHFQKIITVCKVLFGTAAKKYPFFFVLETLKTILDAAIPFIGLYYSPLLIDEIIGDRDATKMIRYAVILVVSVSVANILLRAIITQIEKYQERLSNYFSMQIGMHSMNLDFQFTEDKEALDQIDKANTGMSWYSGGVYGVAEQVFMFFGNVIKIAGFVAIILKSAPWMVLVIGLFVVVNSIVNAKVNKVELEVFKKLAKINRMFGYFGWEAADFKYGKDIRFYEAKDMIVNRWHENTEESGGIWKWEGDEGYKYRKWATVARVLMNIVLYLYVGLLVIAAKITIGTFSQVISASGALDATLNGIIWNIQELEKRCSYAYEYVVFMNYPEAIEKNHDVVNEGLHRIEFRHVSFAYPKTDRLILDDVNIVIEPGEKLSIVGLNGAGKTTFIKLLCRLYDPTAGEILLDGKNIKEYDYKEYMKQFAPVFQDFKLFGFKISENILMKEVEDQTEEERARVAELLRLVELDGLIEKNPKGIDTTIYSIFDEEGVEPSGGEQQKLAIARALYKNAPVIILDEPTAALDPVAEYEIYRQFHTLVGGKTAFYISHRLSSCKFCDKIAVFDGGKIAEYGNHESLASIPNGIYAKMFEAQAQYYR